MYEQICGENLFRFKINSTVLLNGCNNKLDLKIVLIVKHNYIAPKTFLIKNIKKLYGNFGRKTPFFYFCKNIEIEKDNVEGIKVVEEI